MNTKNLEIPAMRFLNFANSPTLKYAERIIHIVLDASHVRQYYESREVLMIVSDFDKEKWFMQKEGLNREARNQIGYVLKLAGFHQASQYRKESTPTHTWRKDHGTTGWGLQAHLQEFRKNFQERLEAIPKSEKERFYAKRPKENNVTLEELI